MFGMTRILFWGIILGIVILILKKKDTLEKKKIITATIVIILLCTVSGIFPVENYFFTFSSPEKAYNYINSEKVKIVVDGENSALVVGEKATADYVYLIIPKYSNGWKLGRGIDTKLVNQTMGNGIVINLYQYQESNDYYITILDMGEEKLEITDNCDSKFLTFDDESDQGYKHYFAHIPSYDANYWVKINDYEYSFEE